MYHYLVGTILLGGLIFGLVLVGLAVFDFLGWETRWGGR
jgi:hypothetical protein